MWFLLNLHKSVAGTNFCNTRQMSRRKTKHVYLCVQSYRLGEGFRKHTQGGGWKLQLLQHLQQTVINFQRNDETKGKWFQLPKARVYKKINVWGKNGVRFVCRSFRCHLCAGEGCLQERGIYFSWVERGHRRASSLLLLNCFRLRKFSMF